MSVHKSIEESCISGRRVLQVSLRELLVFEVGVVFFSGGTGDGLFGGRGLLGLLGLSLVPQSSSHSLLCFFSTASILQRTAKKKKRVRDARYFPCDKTMLNWQLNGHLNHKVRCILLHLFLIALLFLCSFLRDLHLSPVKAHDIYTK